MYGGCKRLKTFEKGNSKRKKRSWPEQCRRIVMVESLFKIDIHEFIVRKLEESWVTSLDRTWPLGTNTEKMAVNFIQSWSSARCKQLKYKGAMTSVV